MEPKQQCAEIEPVIESSDLELQFLKAEKET